MGVVAVRARSALNQAIPSGVFTAISLELTRFDTDTMHDNVVNNSRLTCKTAGKFQITGHIDFPAIAGATAAECTVRLNGATDLGDTGVLPPTAALDNVMTITTLWDLAVGDFVELMAFQNSGAPVNAKAAVAFGNEFEMVKVG